MQPQVENIHCTTLVQPFTAKYINKQRGPIALPRFGYKTVHRANSYQDLSDFHVISPTCSAQQL